LTGTALRANSPPIIFKRKAVFYVARPELGTKRVCPVTGKKFYDLNRDPIVSPFTGQSYPLSAFGPPARGAPGRAAAAAAVADDEVDVAPVGDVELVSLEDADAEAAGPAAVVDDDVEVEADVVEAEPFLEEEEEGEDDVTDLIGDVEDDEEV
jgi:uncharacterized protein (TIGR02300 family)